jgi:flagellar biogenesis protein FliO
LQFLAHFVQHNEENMLKISLALLAALAVVAIAVWMISLYLMR